MADMSGKKRKRPEEEMAKSKKKANVEKQATAPHQIQVSSIVKPKFSPPVIATAPGLVLTDSVQFHSYAKVDNSTSKKRKNSAANPPKDLLLHSTSHRTLDYTAREDGPRGTDSALKHYVGVFDPATGNLQIVEARKMVVRGAVRSQKAAEEAMAERTTRQTLVDMKTGLGEAFGTKKAKKAIQSLTLNAINSGDGKMGEGELVIMDTIKTTTKDMATREELQAAVDQARPIPRGNFDAEDIQDVYVPAEIIGAEVLNAIPVLDWQEKAKGREAIEVASRFVANRINRVATAKDEHAVQRLKLLRYLLFVLVFWGTTTQGRARGTRSIGKRDKLREVMAPAPEMVIENIRRKFSDNGEMRKTHMDLLMTHCCVFASIIDNFEVNIYDLREDLNVEQKHLSQYFMEIGARMKQSKEGDKIHHIAKLALPLQFPKIRQVRQRR
ncbi:DNA-directed RNA polymerase I subunit rpa49 [Diplogelasinospora grovesii]|uniref:DNA-directed RNA polymerase I subunit rpa49 n=1 Tax=Diplogelasinospora grovesii TaxID=303347 RepID=A0AAN6NDZ1_9PEZI|nr:DNA-directed RNA polymerase I subunit rpa49 [Diplogelasinospora grovesii]